MLYGGANFMPIAVPHFCLSVFFLNVNMLFFNTTSKSNTTSNTTSQSFISFFVLLLCWSSDHPFGVDSLFALLSGII